MRRWRRQTLRFILPSQPRRAAAESRQAGWGRPPGGPAATCQRPGFQTKGEGGGVRNLSFQLCRGVWTKKIKSDLNNTGTLFIAGATKIYRRGGISRSSALTKVQLWRKINISVKWRMKTQSLDPWLVEKWTLLKVEKNDHSARIVISSYSWGWLWLTALWLCKRQGELFGYAKICTEPNLE